MTEHRIKHNITDSWQKPERNLPVPHWLRFQSQYPPTVESFASDPRNYMFE